MTFTYEDQIILIRDKNGLCVTKKEVMEMCRNNQMVVPTTKFLKERGDVLIINNKLTLNQLYTIVLHYSHNCFYYEQTEYIPIDPIEFIHKNNVVKVDCRRLRFRKFKDYYYVYLYLIEKDNPEFNKIVCYNFNSFVIRQLGLIKKRQMTEILKLSLTLPLTNRQKNNIYTHVVDINYEIKNMVDYEIYIGYSDDPQTHFYVACRNMTFKEIEYFIRKYGIELLCYGSLHRILLNRNYTDEQLRSIKIAAYLAGLNFDYDPEYRIMPVYVALCGSQIEENDIHNMSLMWLYDPVIWRYVEKFV